MTDFNTGICESCGMEVPIANVCPHCAHTHTDKWTAHATKAAELGSAAFGLCICVFLYMFEWNNFSDTFIPATAAGLLAAVAWMGLMSILPDVEDVKKNLDRIRTQTELPLGVGFGIKDGETAAKVAQVSDAVIVGSALVNCIAKQPEDLAAIKSDLTALMTEIRSAMDA